MNKERNKQPNDNYAPIYYILTHLYAHAYKRMRLCLCMHGVSHLTTTYTGPIS